MSRRSCPICTGRVALDSLPVSIRRHGETIYRLRVPAWSCTACGYLDIDEPVRESVIASLEQHSRPGDDIVFPVEGDTDGQVT